MDNIEYANSFGADIETIQKVIDVLNKYGENKWWLSDNPKVRAYYQLKEDIFILNDFGDFQLDIENFLERPVFTHEFGLNREGLLKEAEEKWNDTE